MAKLSQSEAETLIGKPMADFDESDMNRINQIEKERLDNPVDGMALAAAASAGVTSPASISATETPTVDGLHTRVLGLEALVAHMLGHYFPNVKPAEVVQNWLDGQQPSEVLDKNAFARG